MKIAKCSSAALSISCGSALGSLLFLLDMHPLAAASRSRLLETEPKLFVLETSHYAFCGRY